MALAAGLGAPAWAILAAASDWQLPADFLIAPLSSEQVPSADVRPDVQRGGERHEEISDCICGCARHRRPSVC
jgi:hypothetical protein